MQGDATLQDLSRKSRDEIKNKECGSRRQGRVYCFQLDASLACRGGFEEKLEDEEASEHSPTRSGFRVRASNAHP